MANTKKKHPNAIHLNGGAYKINRKGEPESVDCIIAPTSDDCCLLDCCTKSIKWIGPNGEKREVKLEDLYALINP